MLATLTTHALAVLFLAAASTTPPPETNPEIEQPPLGEDAVVENEAAVESCVDRGSASETCFSRQPESARRLNRAQVDAIQQRRSPPPSAAPSGPPASSRPMRNCASGRC